MVTPAAVDQVRGLMWNFILTPAVDVTLLCTDWSTLALHGAAGLPATGRVLDTLRVVIHWFGLSARSHSAVQLHGPSRREGLVSCS